MAGVHTVRRQAETQGQGHRTADKQIICCETHLRYRETCEQPLKVRPADQRVQTPPNLTLCSPRWPDEKDVLSTHRRQEQQPHLQTVTRQRASHGFLVARHAQACRSVQAECSSTAAHAAAEVHISSQDRMCAHSKAGIKATGSLDTPSHFCCIPSPGIPSLSNTNMDPCIHLGSPSQKQLPSVLRRLRGYLCSGNRASLVLRGYRPTSRAVAEYPYI